MKTCIRCHQDKPDFDFGKCGMRKSGLLSWCKECESDRCKVKYEARKNAQLEKAKEWRSSNKEKFALSIQSWRKANPNRMKELYRSWAQANKDKVNAKWMARDAAKKNRTPNWLTEDDHWMIEQAYDIASKRKQLFGFDWHVDHIVPLQGKTVSGLHVPWNLQVIPAKLNQQKSNRFN
jgi:hypothetical protein